MAKKKTKQEPQIEEQITETSQVEINEETSTESKGLGDTIKKITRWFGIEPCDACEARAKKLNQMFSYLKRVTRPITEEEAEQIETWKTTKKVDIIPLTNLYNEIFGDKQKPSSCVPCNKTMLEKLLIQIEKQDIEAGNK